MSGVAYGFFQAAAEFEILWIEDASRVRGPPHDGLIIGKPGKDAALIGVQQALSRQVAAKTQQTVGLPKCRVNRGEIIRRRFWVDPVQCRSIHGYR